jgi:hypothetical protein
LIYSFENEIHSSCCNLREKINKYNTRGVKKTTFHQHAKVGTAGDTVLLSAANSCAASYMRMRTTVKHHAAGTVKRTVLYKDFCISFRNWGWRLTLSLRIIYCTGIKKELKKKKRLIICYRKYQVAIGGAAVPQCLYASRPWFWRWYIAHRITGFLDSTDGTSGRYYMSSQFLPRFVALILMHLVLLVMFVAQISTSFSIPVPGMFVFYHNFYCRLSYFLPQNLHGLE